MNTADKELSFLDHLEILRWHLIRSAIAVFFFAIITFIFKDIVFDSILLGPQSPNFPTYKALCAISQYLALGDALCLKESPFSLMNISMSGQFSTHIRTSIFGGFIIAFPYVFWEFWRFVSPGLHANESKMARGIVFFSSVLFLFGILFGYYIIAPLSVNFLGSYQVSSSVANQISLTSFITTVTTVSFATGIIFELPILVYFLTKIGLLTPDFMRIYRRHAIVLILILAAIITPPDVTSQIIVLLPLIVLYELSIGISARVINKRKKI
ncbi:MAG: twin-arginine translocase subunit TatC [Flavobacteriales bacterium]|mgnify:CR=1 FL=1|nr:twin-arginine translocase subunit TatC [Flavobacteriales bacterium]MAU37668.1 twin-arginine translocase subunit TatC [Flavobacteriales bacterium]|tara:strand:- start:12640 stop:13446 length:807 start_codon:yes stop_codon:yes gene_type:complete